MPTIKDVTRTDSGGFTMADMWHVLEHRCAAGLSDINCLHKQCCKRPAKEHHWSSNKPAAGSCDISWPRFHLLAPAMQ
jgi:hypothetical protein